MRRPSPPIGLTAADLFAGGKVSRADSRVRSPGTFTFARCPAVRSACRTGGVSQSGGSLVGGLCSFRGHPGPKGHCRTGGWSSQSNNVRGSSASAPRGSGPRRGVARLAGMRRIFLGAVAGVFLLAVGTRAADALGIGGPRLRCGCTETCWCKRPGLTVFRWVTPGRWHHIGLTAEEKRFRHSQA